jgi:pheromone shutdown-related protein TraB
MAARTSRHGGLPLLGRPVTLPGVSDEHREPAPEPRAGEAARDAHPSDVRCVEADGRTFLLVGTAHISRESVELVREVIEKEQPDCVCVELDVQRHEALSHRRRWEALDLRQVIRNKQLSTLLINLLLASYQKRLGGKLGVVPGSELVEAVKVAEENGIPIALCDRDIRATLRRAWHSLSFFRKLRLLSELLVSAFETPELSEDTLREMRERDVLSELMNELGRAFPSLKRTLIDERDAYLAQRIRETSGEKVVAVVGAGHVEGMVGALRSGEPVDLEELGAIPPVSPLWKWVGWGIPALIVGSLAWIGVTQGGAAAGENALYWFFANAIPSAIGAVLAAAHPATIAAAFASAPFTSLTPVIGAGYVCAFVQLWFRPPVVREFQTVGDDVLALRGWWQSRLLRIFLVFLLTTLGSVIGTWVGGARILSNLF